MISITSFRFTIARTLNQHHGLNLGVYGNVTAPGVVTVGDPVTVG